MKSFVLIWIISQARKSHPFSIIRLENCVISVLTHLVEQIPALAGGEFERLK